MGLVEGATEFLPISSTGHLIIASKLLGIIDSPFLKSFEIIIQLGSILAVLFLYGSVLLRNWELTKRVAVAFLPTAFIGLLFYPIIKGYLLGNTLVVGLALIVGGVLMLLFEKWYRPERATMSAGHELTYKNAGVIGLWQSLAVIPGVSRSAATSIGGMVLGLDRKATVEFSFLLALPTIAAATALDILKNYQTILSGGNALLLLVGFLAAFASAMLTIRWFLHHVQTRTFREFGWYRIIVGLLFLFFFLK